MYFIVGIIVGFIIGVVAEALIIKRPRSRDYEEGFAAGCRFMQHTKIPNNNHKK